MVSGKILRKVCNVGEPRNKCLFRKSKNQFVDFGTELVMSRTGIVEKRTNTRREIERIQSVTWFNEKQVFEKLIP